MSVSQACGLENAYENAEGIDAVAMYAVGGCYNVASLNDKMACEKHEDRRRARLHPTKTAKKAQVTQ